MEFIKEQKIDIMMLGKTWLRNGDAFTIPNFIVYRNDKLEQPGGGTAICIKKSLKHTEHKNEKSKIENTSIILHSKKGDIKLTAAYNSPNKIKNLDLDPLLKGKLPALLLGDLNAKNVIWGCNSTNPAGTTLYNYMKANDVLVAAPTSPTHFGPVGRPEILDIGLIKGIKQNIEIETIADLCSDHNPIVTDIHFLTKTKQTIKKVNWTKYHFHLRNHTNNIPFLNSTNDIDEQIREFTKEIAEALEHSTAIKEIDSDIPFETPEAIRQLMCEKRKAHKKPKEHVTPLTSEKQTA